MNTISITKKGVNHNRKVSKQSARLSIKNLVKAYLSYADRQQSSNIYWFMKAVVALPCVYMVISIIAMASMVDAHEYFVGFAMLLFFANILVHIAGVGSRVFVALYHVSAALFVLIPTITYLITQL